MPPPALKKHKPTSKVALTSAPNPDNDPDDDLDVDQNMLMPDAEEDIPYDDSDGPPPEHLHVAVHANGKNSTSDVDLLPIIPPNWTRSPVPPIDPATQPITFMQVDASLSTARNPCIPAVINLFGLTEAGNSVLLRVNDFFHYFYVPVTQDVSGDEVKHALNKRLHAQLMGKKDNFDVPRDLQIIRSVEIVVKRSIMNYIPGDPKLRFYKITVLHPRFIRDAADIFQKECLSVTKANGERTSLPTTTVFEATLEYLLRFMIEVGLVGCSWIEIPPGQYNLARTSNHISHMQIEIDLHLKFKSNAFNLLAHKPEGKWLNTAPLRRLSFDIECSGRKGYFPEAEQDSVIQIGNYIWDHGKKSHSAKVIFTLKSCAAIVGTDVCSFNTEEQLLAAWSRFLRICDPDIITGYNIVNFDLPYLMDRSSHLGVMEFPFLGRLINQPTLMRKVKMSSSAFGTHESRSYSAHGRVIFDMLQLVTREYKLRSYSLNAVSAEFLGQQKEDVHYSIISDLQKGDENTRRRLAVYCLKDSLLPLNLMDKLLALTNYIEMARVTGIPLGWLVSRGHMIKVVSLLHRKSHAENLLIPDIKRDGRQGGASGEGPQYIGATVIEPERDFYKVPIATLDFASLYPSIIMAHNLCYSTLLLDEHRKSMNDDDVSKTPTGAWFVKEHVKQGILTKMLKELLAARKQAKKELKEATDPFMKSVLNGRQLALKISANAVYGFTGAQVGKLPCMDISASTTAYGRDMILKTKEEVMKRYPGSRVIYGDTDSVMVKFGKDVGLEESMKLGNQAADEISKIFPDPVKLEFEKCYFPYLLISKKRYAGLTWTNTEKYDKMDCKGIESVRRDNCRLVANVISSVLELLLKQRDHEKAIAMVKQTVSDLLQNKMDISLLVVSKALTKVDYASKQAHVELANKMKKRKNSTAPSLGDRVPYVITMGSKKQPAYARAEDPLYVLENNVPIDNAYYLENMLRKPLERIFEPVMGKNASSLFSGEHTRTIAVATPKNTNMMKFASVRLTCLGCKTPIKSGAICKYCVPKEAAIYDKHLRGVTVLEKAHASLWTECQRCMGELCHDVLCSNGDCPIFYRRRKTQKDLDIAMQKLSRFDIDW